MVINDWVHIELDEHMKFDKTKLDDIEYSPLREEVKGTLDSLVEEIDGGKS